MHFKSIINLISLLFFLFFSAFPMFSDACAGQASFSAAVLTVEAASGQTIEVLVRIKIEKPYHIYAPGDKTGVPVSFKISAEDAVSYETAFPEPLKKKIMGEDLLLFEDSAEARILLSVNPRHAGKSVKIPVEVQYQACTDDMCTAPQKETFEISLSVKAAAPIQTGGPASPESTNAANGSNSFIVKTTAANGTDKNSSGSTPETQISKDAANAGKTPAISNDPANAKKTSDITGSVVDEKKQPGSGSVSKNSGSKSTFMKFYEESFIYAILIAFFWGLVSSLTPCVYPMIPITVAFFANQGENSRARTFSLALTFVVGIALSFAILGVAVTLFGVDMGSIMANPWIVGFVCALLLFFAGAMFEFYEIKMPDAVMSKVGQSEQGFYGAFTMGLTMGLVAAPCVGPFAGSLLIFVSAIKSIPIGFIMLFSYGMGLGMLFLVFAMGARFMPRSGMWMVRVKNFFGLVLLWITLYFMQFVMAKAALIITAGIFASLTAVILGVFSTVDENTPVANHLAKALGIVSVFIAALFFASGISELGFISLSGNGRTNGHEAVSTNAQNASGGPSKISSAEFSDWIKDYDEGMALAKAGKKPVIIDFYADWCIPCKQMDSDIFKNPDFINASKNFVKIKLDCTNSSGKGALIKKEKFSSPFMPYIVFYESSGALYPKEIQGYIKLPEMLEMINSIK